MHNGGTGCWHPLPSDSAPKAPPAVCGTQSVISLFTNELTLTSVHEAGPLLDSIGDKPVISAGKHARAPGMGRKQNCFLKKTEGEY